MTRKTIGDNPLDAYLSEPVSPVKDKADSRKRPGTRETAQGERKERLTVHLPVNLIERVKNAVFWSPGLTLAGLTEAALEVALEELERENRGPFKKRKKELKGGRPIK